MRYTIEKDGKRSYLVFHLEEHDGDMAEELKCLPEMEALDCILEDVGDDLKMIDPADIGALTSAPIIGIGERVFWFPNYQIESCVETLVEKGEVRFIEAEEE